jgi:hypothetical protein
MKRFGVFKNRGLRGIFGQNLGDIALSQNIGSLEIS